MESLPEIPQDILKYIILLSDTEIKNLAMTSHMWNETVKLALSSLLKSYKENDSLRSYTDLADQIFVSKDVSAVSKDLKEGQNIDQKFTENIQNIQKVKFVFQKIMQEAHQMGYPEEAPTMQTLSGAHLKEVDEWTQEQKALNQLAAKIPEMTIFLYTIQSLPPLEKNEKIRNWMPNNLNRIERLNLEKSDFTTLPKEIQYLIRLKRLSLLDNQLHVLPPEIKSWTELESLILTNNNLTTLPSEIGFLTMLQRLYLPNNRLKSLPSEIKYLTDLESLNLSRNQLTAIPSEIAFLTKLETLNLSGNRLTTIPSGLESLIKLEELDLSQNEIKAFPNKIGYLVHQGNGKYSLSGSG